MPQGLWAGCHNTPRLSKNPTVRFCISLLVKVDLAGIPPAQGRILHHAISGKPGHQGAAMCFRQVAAPTPA